MEKTKLGISVGLMAAITFFSGLFISGELSILLILLAGYCLLAEENVWLKKCAVKAVALMVIFAVVTTVVGLIPEAFNFIDGIFMIFNGRFSVPIIEGIAETLLIGLGWIETALFLILGITALKQSTVRIPVIDDLIGKYIG